MTDGYTVKATPSGENTYLEKTEIEFVNDWSELEAAIEKIDDFHDRYTEWDDDAWRVITHYVPRLLTQYASLVELSFALTEGWEQYASLQPKAGLYLPDHR